MKKRFILLLFVITSCASISALANTDTTGNAGSASTTASTTDEGQAADSTETTPGANKLTTTIEKKVVQDSTMSKKIEESSRPVAYTHLKEFDFLGKTMIWLISLIIIASIVALIWGNAWLKNALTDNASEKKTIPNPQYALLLGVIASNSGTSQANPAQIQAALATAQASLTTQNDAIAAVPADPAAIAAATAAHNSNITSLGALINPTGSSVGVMNSLGSLFPPTVEVTNDKPGINGASFRPSASRLLAFFSGVLLMLVGLCCSCFYIYFYLVSGVAPDLGKLTGIFIALGIGMAPYAVNKVANATTSKDKTI